VYIVITCEIIRGGGSDLLILAEHMIVAVNHIVTGYYRGTTGSLWRGRQEDWTSRVTGRLKDKNETEEMRRPSRFFLAE